MSGRPLPWWLAAALAAVLGTGAGVAAWSTYDAEAERQEMFGDPGDRVSTAVEALLDEPVYVAPESQDVLAPDDAERIAASIRERDLPVHVVVWEPSSSAGYSSPIQATEQLSFALTEATGEPAAVVVWGTGDEGRLDATPGWRWDPDVGFEEREPEYLGDAAPRLTEWVETLPAGGEPLVELDPDRSVGFGIFLGLVVALPVVAVVAGVLALATARLRRRAG